MPIGGDGLGYFMPHDDFAGIDDAEGTVIVVLQYWLIW